MAEIINAVEAYKVGFDHCKYCHSFPVVKINGNYANAVCAGCGSYVELFGTMEIWESEIKDAWNKGNQKG